VVVPNPNVTRTHTSIEWTAPDGDSTGLAFDPVRGWFVTLLVGDQTPPTPLLLRYAAPRVAAVTLSSSGGAATGLPTRGGLVLSISGANFGAYSFPAVALASPTSVRPPLNCSGVVRLSHFNLTCLLPAGSGAGLQVVVSVGDQSGAGGAVTYAQPSVTGMQLVYLSTLPAGALAATPGQRFPATWAANQSIALNDTSTAALVGQPGRSSAWPALSGYAIVVTGTNFGAYDTASNCLVALAPWRSVASGPPVCNGMEDFLGEGEVAAWDVLTYGHEIAVVLLPPGAGARTVAVVAGGQVSSTRAPNFVYTAPVLLGPLRPPPGGQLSTAGGDVVNLPVVYTPLPTVNNASSPVIAMPLPLPLPWGTRMPSEHLRVNFTSKCLAAAYTPTGAVPPGFATCIAPAIVAVTPSADPNGP